MTFDEIMLKVRPVSSDQMLHDDEAELLYNCLCEVPNGGIAVEIGCQIGRSSTLIAQVAQARRFHTLHIDPQTNQRQWAMDWVGNMMLAQGEGEDHEFAGLFMRTAQAGWILSRMAPFDFAYIDGDHTYPGVKTDLEMVADRVRSGGIMCAHDYGEASLPDVYRAVSEYMAERGQFWEPIKVVRVMGAWRRK